MSAGLEWLQMHQHSSRTVCHLPLQQQMQRTTCLLRHRSSNKLQHLLLVALLLLSVIG
jgi:hypothetical protein